MWIRHLVSLLALIGSFAASAEDHLPAVELPADAPPCVHWAAEEVTRVLASHGYVNALTASAVRVTADEAGTAESYRLARTQDNVLLVTGSDPNGVMYGLLDLAEQFDAAAPGVDWATAQYNVALRQSQPLVCWRGLNVFLQLQSDGTVAGWFHDDVFWSRLLDLLARSRFNWIDLHGAYSPHSTIFSNLLPHFTTMGVENEAAARNLAMLNRVVAMAGARGIRVSLMNYDDRDPTGKDRDDRIEATGHRIGELMRGCPGLWMIGTRVKRSGGSTVDRFEDSYVKPARAAGFQGPLYTRSWGTDRWTVERLAREADGRFFVEVKYNGEQLGTPYPALQGWGEDYSYQNFLDKPRRFEVIWQVRANGTCRVFQWGDPDFVRTAARSFGLGGAAGFSVEPHWAYFLPDPALRYRDPSAALVEGEQYLFERDWAWYQQWGRLTYDPSTPDAVLLRPWVQRYGPQAGDAAARSLMWMSRVLTTLYQAQAYGVDHRDAAPEMEFGLLTKNRDHWRTLDELCAIGPLDRARGCSPQDFAEAVGGRYEPRMTPIDFAAELERLATETNTAADELTAMLPRAKNAPAARTLALEAHMLAGLGLSGAARLRALTAFAFYRKTKDARWLTKSKEELERAAARWLELADTADKLFLPVQDPLRAGRDFTWNSLQAHYQRMQTELEKVIQKARKEKRAKGGEPVGADVYARSRAVFGNAQTVLQQKGNEGMHVELRFPDGQPVPSRVTVLFKPLDSQLAWSEAKMDHRGNAFSSDLKDADGGLLIQFQGTDDQGRGWLWPDATAGLPFLWSSR